MPHKCNLVAGLLIFVFLFIQFRCNFFVALTTGYEDLGQTHDFGKSGYHTSVSPSQSKSNTGLIFFTKIYHVKFNLFS